MLKWEQISSFPGVKHECTIQKYGVRSELRKSKKKGEKSKIVISLKDVR